MKRTPFGSRPCSIARAVELLGDGWTPLVLREISYGTRRFEELQETLGLGRNMLAQRLNRLVDEGLLDRVPYEERRPRHEYVLTAKGRDFFPVLVAIGLWGDTWLAGEAGPPVALRHHGHEIQAAVTCVECGDGVRLEDVKPGVGPGMTPRQAQQAVASGRFVPREDGNDGPRGEVSRVDVARGEVSRTDVSRGDVPPEDPVEVPRAEGIGVQIPEGMCWVPGNRRAAEG
jgi:DNA-binding HxlR family transcriptional regulator